MSRGGNEAIRRRDDSVHHGMDELDSQQGAVQHTPDDYGAILQACIHVLVILGEADTLDTLTVRALRKR